MKFDLEEAINIANEALLTNTKRNLTDVEIIVLKGSWERDDYDLIAAKHQYATSYISQDVAPKLWKGLSEALGEKVRKSNFKEALRRWQQQYSNGDNSLLSSFNSHTVKFSPQNSETGQQATSQFNEIYVERPPIEKICYETLLQAGSLIRIKAPSLMGKTSLVTKLLAQISQKQEFRTINLSLKLAERNTHLISLDRFLRWFCANISRQLGLPSELDEYWDEEGIGSKVSCTTYLEEYILVAAESPLVLCLDDVDWLFPYPEIYEDFFGLLRSWHEKARSRKLWQQMRLIIVHATDVYIRLNINQSPFNVGLPITLVEFNQEQVQELAQKQELKPNMEIIQSLMDLVGGHPYLLELAFTHLKNYPNLDIKQMLAEATTDTGIYSRHLRDFWLNLQECPQLIPAFQQVISCEHPVKLDPVSAYQLQSMGLIKLSGNEAEPRCDLYRKYFSDRLEGTSCYV